MPCFFEYRSRVCLAPLSTGAMTGEMGLGAVRDEGCTGGSSSSSSLLGGRW